MSSQVLRTKLFIPPLKPNLVSRDRLLFRLNEARRQGQHLVLVSAPAGFGKSTLVSQWINSSRLRSVWITLDEADNDPIRLWRHLLAALVEDRSSDETPRSELLTSPQPPLFKVLVSALINDLVSLPAPLAIVLDDYHILTNDEIHQGIGYLLDHLPDQVTLCILTRADPPISISRMRGKGELCEIRAADLRFDASEAAEFFNAKMKLDLPLRDLDALGNKTEGWIAGLQMAAISLQGTEDRHGFITAFSGDDRYIADYLLEEVLNRQPQAIQDFLLTTSLLDRMCAPLCNYLTGRSDSQLILTALDRDNIFLVPLDNRREWFRYHHLFASLLRQNLTQMKGMEEVEALQQRVIDWYQRNGYLYDAIEMAITGQSYALAADLIDQIVVQLMSGSELTTLLKWTQILPTSILEFHHRICIFSAWAANATARNDLCRHFLSIYEGKIGCDVRSLFGEPHAIAAMQPEERNRILEAAVIYIRIAVDDFEIDRVFRQSEIILPYLNEENDRFTYISNPPSALYSPVRLMQGVLYKAIGRLDEACAAFEDSIARASSQKTFNIHILALGYSHLGEIMILRGQLDAAAAAFSSAIRTSKASANSTSVFFSLSLAGLGLVECEKGNSIEARRLLNDAIGMARLWNHWDTLIPASLALARVEFHAGSVEKSIQILDHLAGRLREDFPAAEMIAQGMIAWFQAANGLHIPAIAWEKALGAASAGHVYFLEHGAWLRTMVMLHIGNFADALSILAPAITEAQKSGKFGKLVGLFACQAAAFHGLGRNEEAAIALRSALDLALVQGAFQSIVECSGHLRELLLSELRSLPNRTDTARAGLVRRLLAVSQPAQSSQAEVSSTREWQEPLSARELEVLKCIVDGMANSQIAARLVVSPNTVKKHVSSIFAKLNVTTRLQAVEKARRENLLPK